MNFTENITVCGITFRIFFSVAVRSFYFECLEAIFRPSFVMNFWIYFLLFFISRWQGVDSNWRG